MAQAGARNNKKNYARKNFDKEKMYEKIMPSMSRPEEANPLGNVPMLHNYMEDILLDKLEETMRFMSCCKCVRCERDILAMTLNSLPALYIIMAEGEELEKKIMGLRAKHDARATATLIRAIRVVRSNPRHTGAL